MVRPGPHESLVTGHAARGVLVTPPRAAASLFENGFKPLRPFVVASCAVATNGFGLVPGLWSDLRDMLDHSKTDLGVVRIVHYLAEHFPATVYNLPPDPSAVPEEPEGA